MMLAKVTRKLSWLGACNVLVMSVFVGSLTACGSGDPGQRVCGGSSPSQVTTSENNNKAFVTGISGLEVLRHQIGERSVPIEESIGAFPEELELRVWLSYDFPQQTKNTQPWLKLEWLFRSALACSPVFVEPAFSSKISNADLVSSASMGPGLPAGSSLGSAFVINANNADENTDVVSDAPPQYPLNEYGSPGSVTASSSYFVTVPVANATQLMPEAAQVHQLTFSITLDDGKSFSATSRGIRILPPT